MKLHPKILQGTLLALLSIGIISIFSLNINQRLQGQTSSECTRAVPQGGTCNSAAGETPTPGFLYGMNGECVSETGCFCYTSAVCDCGNGVNGLCFAGTCSSCENDSSGGQTESGGADGDSPPEPECETDDQCVPQNLCEPGSCVNNECVYVLKNCDDGNSCTIDTCDAQNGECQNTSKDCSSLNSACADGACSDGQCFSVKKDSCGTVPPGGGDFSGDAGGTPPGPACTGLGDCDDGDVCTLDYCGISGCFYTPNIGDARCPTGSDNGGSGNDNGDSEGGTDGEPPASSAASSISSQVSSAANSSVISSCKGDCVRDCNERASRCQESCNDQHCPGWRDPDFTGPCADPEQTLVCGNQCKIIENNCRDRCETKCAPRSATSNASQASQTSSVSLSICAQNETYCETDMFVACTCNGLITDYSCTAGTCFSCPACPQAASSTSSANSNSSTSLTSFCEAFQESYCFRLKYQLLDEGLDVDLPLDCLYHEYCMDCTPFRQDCLKTCFTPLCGPDGFFMTSFTQVCANNECSTPRQPSVCDTDSDCGPDACTGCGYNEQEQACTQECERNICIDEQCRKTIASQETCDEKCEENACDQEDVPECEEGNFAFCCKDGEWECIPEEIDPDFAEEFLCSNNDECPLQTSCVASPECKGVTIGDCGNGNVCCTDAAKSSASSSFFSSSALTTIRSSSSSSRSLLVSSSSSSSSSLFVSSSSSSSSSLFVSSSSSSSSSSTLSSSSSSSLFAAPPVVPTFNGGSSSETIQLSLIQCGNGVLETGEQCDDGNDVNDDGCNNACRVNITPGDPVPSDDDDGDGDNDDGVANNADDEDDNGDEDNDDGTPRNQRDDDNGNGDNDDGIPGNSRNSQSLVASANICGNGALESSEECDDSNRRDNDGCSSSCQLEIGVCGDGVVQKLLGEQCEQSLHDRSLPYSCVRCQFVSLTCGDSVVDAGEECDEGRGNSTTADATCRPDCSLGRCGDKVLDKNEQCDDGNRRNGDGCDRYCRTESTQVAAETQVYTPEQLVGMLLRGEISPAEYEKIIATLPLPTQPNFQPVPYQLPLAQLQPLIQNQGPVGDTGPAAVAVVGAGAAAGWSFIRRRKR